MSDTTRAFFVELKRVLDAAKISLNSFSTMTHIPRKRIARMFSGGVPSERELRTMSRVLMNTLEPQHVRTEAQQEEVKI